MNNQPEESQEPSLLDLEITKLHQQLSEVAAADSFFETASGRLFVLLVQQEVNAGMKDIMSSKYEKDHMGYLKRLADVQAYQKILRKLQVAKSPKRRAIIVEKLDELEDAK